jgi:hypothetical protein
MITQKEIQQYHQASKNAELAEDHYQKLRIRLARRVHRNETIQIGTLSLKYSQWLRTDVKYKAVVQGIVRIIKKLFNEKSSEREELMKAVYRLTRRHTSKGNQFYLEVK